MNQLRNKRKQLGFTQVEMAKLCGVSRRTYQTYEEQDKNNKTYKELEKLLEIIGNGEPILNIKSIKKLCAPIFQQYPEVKCAYLYGSYARGEATRKSDVDILVVCHGMGLRFFQMAGDLQDALQKEVDLQTHEQIVDSDSLIEDILVEGIKLYG